MTNNEDFKRKRGGLFLYFYVVWHLAETMAQEQSEGHRATFQGKETYFRFLCKLSTKSNIGRENNQC